MNEYTVVCRTHHNKVESTQSDENLQKSSNDQSSNSECVVTIQHKHQRRKIPFHHRQQNHHTTASFDSPLSDYQLDSMNSTDDFPVIDQQSNSFELLPISSNTSSETLDSPIYQYSDMMDENNPLISSSNIQLE